MGEREDRLGQALYALERDEVAIVTRSSVYETEPQDVANQPWFLNMAVECRTRALPLQLARAHQRFERDLQILNIGCLPVVEQYQIDGELLQPPIFMRLQQLAGDVEIVGIGDAQQ